MGKVLLCVHQGFSVRYLLQTDILKTLCAEAEVWVLTQEDPDVLRTVLGEKVAGVRNIAATKSRRYFGGSRLQRCLSIIRLCTLAKAVSTSDIWWDRLLGDAHRSGIGIKTKVLHKALRMAITVSRRSRLLRRLIIWLEHFLYTPQGHIDLIRDIDPHLVVTTSLGTFDYDQYVMRAAHRLGVSSVAVILSWDNTTTRGYAGARCDHVIAWGETMKQELVTLHDFDPARVTVGGIAHFDPYFRQDNVMDREVFIASMGLDPTKRTIAFATKSPNGYPYNPNIVKIIGEAIEDGRLPSDVQLLVRVHPLHYKFAHREFVFKELLDLYDKLASTYPNVVIDKPDFFSHEINYSMHEDETIKLKNLIIHCDILLNIFSTMNIEGAIFDKPLVNICFEGKSDLYNFEYKSRFDIFSDLNEAHNQRIVASGGTRISYSPEEMLHALNGYLENPALDAHGRDNIRRAELGPYQGYAGKTIGQILLTLMSKRSHPRQRTCRIKDAKYP